MAVDAAAAQHAPLSCKLSASDGFSLHCAGGALPAAHAAASAAPAVAHEQQLARFAVIGSAFALPLLFMLVAAVRSPKFRGDCMRDPFLILHKGDKVIVEALQDHKLKAHAQALLNFVLLPLMVISLTIVIADEFTERDLVSEIFAYVLEIINVHPVLMPILFISVPSALLGMLKSMAADAILAHGMPFERGDVIEFPQMPALSPQAIPLPMGAPPPGLLVVEVDSLTHTHAQAHRSEAGGRRLHGLHPARGGAQAHCRRPQAVRRRARGRAGRERQRRRRGGGGRAARGWRCWRARAPGQGRGRDVIRGICRSRFLKTRLGASTCATVSASAFCILLQPVGPVPSLRALVDKRRASTADNNTETLVNAFRAAFAGTSLVEPLRAHAASAAAACARAKRARDVLRATGLGSPREKRTNARVLASTYRSIYLISARSFSLSETLLWVTCPQHLVAVDPLN